MKKYYYFLLIVQCFMFKSLYAGDLLEKETSYQSNPEEVANPVSSPVGASTEYQVRNLDLGTPEGEYPPGAAPPTYQTKAYAINQKGMVVGLAFINHNVSAPFFFNPLTMSRPSVISGWSRDSRVIVNSNDFRSVDINDTGDVLFNLIREAHSIYPFLWNYSTGPLSIAFSTEDRNFASRNILSTAINNNFEVAGGGPPPDSFESRSSSDLGYTAYIFWKVNTASLPNPPLWAWRFRDASLRWGDDSISTDINNYVSSGVANPTVIGLTKLSGGAYTGYLKDYFTQSYISSDDDRYRTFPYAINDHKLVVGWMRPRVITQGELLYGAEQEFKAFIYGALSPDTPLSIQRLAPRARYSKAYGINNRGEVVGSASLEQWSSSLVSSLQTLWNNLNGKNILNQEKEDHRGLTPLTPLSSSSPKHAFLWRNGILSDLNTLIPPRSGWELVEARDINDQGWIVGWGYLNSSHNPRAFLLIPSSSPAN